MKKTDIKYKLVVTILWCFGAWVAWCLFATVRLMFVPYGFFGFLDCLPIIFCILMASMVWSDKLKAKRKLCLAVYIGVSIVLIIGSTLSWKDDRNDTLKQNFNTKEYLPFQKDSKIARLKEESTLKLKDHLPVLDGAAALFPVYSAVVNEVYPQDTKLMDVYDENCAFVYNNTVDGYGYLIDGETDIFFGVHPSEDQIAMAEEYGEKYRLTPIGKEAFIFFVNKDNPVDNLSRQQIKDIYAGKIKNWKEVGGNDERIDAYQRNEDSGSQTAFLRFMGDIMPMEPPTEQIENMMSGIIEEVADYKNRTNSIGFSFRYYTEEMISNPQIKILSVDGVKPAKNTIRNGSYPLKVYIYAATLENNKRKNVRKVVDWMLSEQGQYIVEKTGYVGIN